MSRYFVAISLDYEFEVEADSQFEAFDDAVDMLTDGTLERDDFKVVVYEIPS